MSIQTKTIDLKGNAYAKVADRLKLFREDHPKGKTESAYEMDVDGSTTFTVWLWKDKAEVIELMKAGVTDKDILRSSSDANGNAKSTESGKKDKDFEKLETIALGRALAMLGYLASGEIASSEEMTEFLQDREDRITEAVNLLKSAKTLQELKVVFTGLGKLKLNKKIIKLKDEKKKELDSENN